jgi:serine/threonine protein kinase
LSIHAGVGSHVSGVRHGTPLYIPPEILANGKASKAADVYSFGVMMWEIFHGRTAWEQVGQWTMHHTCETLAN